jgi:hypothetical protein
VSGPRRMLPKGTCALGLSFVVVICYSNYLYRCIIAAIIVIIMSEANLGSDRHGSHAEAETTGTDARVDK